MSALSLFWLSLTISAAWFAYRDSRGDRREALYERSLDAYRVLGGRHDPPKRHGSEIWWFAALFLACFAVSLRSDYIEARFEREGVKHEAR